MVKQTQAIPLQFDVDVEYSIDDGANWVTLLASTLIELTALNVKVRTTNSVVSLDTFTSALKVSGVVLDELNIRQAKSVTSLQATFQSMTIGKLRIANLPLCTTLQDACRLTTLGELSIENLPLCTTVRSLCESSDIGLVRDMYLPIVDTALYMFKKANLNIIGDFKNNGTTINLQRMFDNATFKSLPTIDVGEIVNIEYFADISSFYYTLHSTFRLRLATSHDARRMFGASVKKRFIGSEIHMLPAASIGTIDIAELSFVTGLKYPFSKLVKTSTNDYIDDGVNNIGAYPDITTAQRALMRNIGANFSLEFNDWLPELKLLESYDTVGTQATSTALQVGSYKYYMYVVSSVGVVSLVKNHKSVEDEATLLPTGKVFATGKVWYARNGWYATTDNTDVKVYNDSDVLQQTIVLANVLHLSLNSNATKMVVVSGNAIVSASNSVTAISQKLSEYDIVTGLLVTERVHTANNVILAGVHRPNDGSNVQVLTSTYLNDGTNNLLQSSTVSSFSSITSTTPIIVATTVLPMDAMHSSHREENEFYVREKATGKSEWYFAK